MRIAHIITRMIVGGAQENTLLCCKDLIRDHGDDTVLITGPALGPEGDLLAREGDTDVSGSGESLEFNGVAQSDASNPADNTFNSTINSLGVTTSWGVDLDTFQDALGNQDL